jgi:sulfur carrier protein ThiS
MAKKKKSKETTPTTVLEVLAASGVRAHLFADSAEGIRVPRSRKAITEVTDGLRKTYLASA